MTPESEKPKTGAFQTSQSTRGADSAPRSDFATDGQLPVNTSQTNAAIDTALSRLSSAEKKAQAKSTLKLGQIAFDRGRYKKAIAHFQAALAQANPMGSLGGEIQLWLVNAYIAAGDQSTGVALCRKLTRHPDLETQRQSKRLLYILEAPELEMKPEWVTKIPDLSSLEDDAIKRYPQRPKRSRRPSKKPEPEPVDLKEVNTAENQFFWVALLATILTLGGVVWLR